MNTIELSGNIVEDLKTSKNKSGTTVVKNKIAVTDSKGTDYEKTYFVPFTVHGTDTIKAMKGLKKGSIVKMQGKLVYINFKNDKDEWINYTNIVVFKIEELKFDKKDKHKCLNPGGFERLQPTGFEAIDDSDIPF